MVCKHTAIKRLSSLSRVPITMHSPSKLLIAGLTVPKAATQKKVTTLAVNIMLVSLSLQSIKGHYIDSQRGIVFSFTDAGSKGDRTRGQGKRRDSRKW